MRLTSALMFDIFLNNLFGIFTYGCYEVAVTPEHGFPVILCYLFLTTASRKAGSLCFDHPDKIQQVYFRPGIKQDMDVVRFPVYFCQDADTLF